MATRANAVEVKECEFGSAKVSKGDLLVQTSPEYYRPVDPARLLGRSAKARRELGWQPQTPFSQLVKLMISHDVKSARLLLEGTKKHKEEWREYVI